MENIVKGITVCAAIAASVADPNLVGYMIFISLVVLFALD